jgi:DNA-binding CsgD family transcriptional regulator
MMDEATAVERLKRLTPRELEVGRCLLGGLHNKEIGKILGITERTVKAHLTSIFEKIDVSSRFKVVEVFLLAGEHNPYFYSSNFANSNAYNPPKDELQAQLLHYIKTHPQVAEDMGRTFGRSSKDLVNELAHSFRGGKTVTNKSGRPEHPEHQELSMMPELSL